jgi:DNA end-binding protein Ku
MARAVWSGSISFGLVNVPVKAYTAMRDHSVHFHQLEKGTGARIRYQKISDKTGEEVAAEDIEQGFEISSGQHVIIDPDEIEALRPEATRSIDVQDFVALDDIDPIYFERTYWLAPGNDTATRAYRLLQRAMDDQQRVGIGSVVMRNTQYLAAIRPLDGALAMSTMRFADEVVDRKDVDELPKPGAKADPKELKMAAQLIDSLTTDWDPTRYHDTYTEQLKELIDAKAKGKEISMPEPGAAPSKVLDLMAALEASLSAAKSKGGKKDLPAALVKAAEELVEDGGDEPEDEADHDADHDAKGAKETKAPATKAPATKAPATKAPAKKGPARKAGGTKKAAAKKQPATKQAAKKSAAKKGPAERKSA